MAKLVPAILAHSKEEFKEKFEFLSPLFDLIQIDIMDGDFVSETTYGNLNEIKDMNSSTALELHLMCESPLSLIDDLDQLDQIQRIIFHYEAVKTKEQIYDIIAEILSAGKEVGVAINPQTSIQQIREFIPKINLLQIMGGEPGKSGQSFNPAMLDKIREARALSKELHIGVDVGVSEGTWKDMVDAGADTLSSASMIFNLKDSKKISSLKQEIENYV